MMAKYRRQIILRWIMVAVIITSIQVLLRILGAMVLGGGLIDGRLSLTTLFELLLALNYLVIEGAAISGVLITALCLFIYLSRLSFSFEVWSTPLSYFDDNPTETVRMMNTNLSRNMKNLYTFIGLGIGLLLILPWVLTIL